MVDLAVEVVTAITSGAAGSLGAKGAEAAGRLISALRAKLHAKPAVGALEVSAGKPDDDDASVNLISMLRDHISQDAEFGAWLANFWNVIRTDLGAEAGRSVNIINSGTVHGSVIQARDVQGGINLGHADGQRPGAV